MIISNSLGCSQDFHVENPVAPIFLVTAAVALFHTISNSLHRLQFLGQPGGNCFSGHPIESQTIFYTTTKQAQHVEKIFALLLAPHRGCSG